ncbi:signal-regulatory protein beta-1-like [Carettochelys insculpta]|uniref:signal-regulatory protein beta-1-like n=1 Tax=Carettochelys insculpta TaxID=44489 RepID=UPI003EBFC3E8
MAPSARGSRWSLPCLVLVLVLLEVSGTRNQELQVLQPQGAVSVSAGGTLTLTCSVTVQVPEGPVRWFKESAPSRQLVYAETGSSPRVSRALPGSNTDFTIHISDTRPEDAGTYCCVKLRRVAGGEEELSSGPGTVVSVSGEWELPAQPHTPPQGWK